MKKYLSTHFKSCVFFVTPKNFQMQLILLSDKKNTFLNYQFISFLWEEKIFNQAGLYKKRTCH